MREDRRSATPESWLKQQQHSAAGTIRSATAFGLAGGALVIGQAWLMAEITDRVIFHEAAVNALAPLLLALAALFLLRAVAASQRRMAGNRAANEVQQAVRRRLFERLRSAGPVALQNKATGEIASAAVEGVEALEPYVARYVPQRAVSTLVPLAVLGAIIPLDWIGALILGATAFFVPVTMVLIGRGAEELNQKQWKRLSLLSNRLLDAVQGLSTTRLFSAVGREAAVIQRMSEDYRDATMRVLRVAFLSSLMLELLSTVSIATLAVSIGLRLLDTELAFRAGYAALLLAPEFYAPLRRLGSDYHARMDAIGAASRLLALQRLETVPVGAAGVSRPALTDAPAVAIEKLSFRYPEAERAAVRDLSLEIRAGSDIALVGASGAGKSTLFLLLMGHIAPEHGAIRIDTTPLSDIDFSHWQEAVALVRQRPHLFAATLADNILLGSRRHSAAALQHAVEESGLGPLAERLEHGLDTRIGEHGAGLSGGERQQVGIARAFLKDSPVVLLDEPTAHLDMASERRLQEAVSRLCRGRTSITIAHRLESVRRADEIVVMAEGEIAERGDHDGLLSAGGAYARLAGHAEDGR